MSGEWLQVVRNSRYFWLRDGHLLLLAASTRVCRAAGRTRAGPDGPSASILRGGYLRQAVPLDVLFVPRSGVQFGGFRLGTARAICIRGRGRNRRGICAGPGDELLAIGRVPTGRRRVFCLAAGTLQQGRAAVFHLYGRSCRPAFRACSPRPTHCLCRTEASIPVRG
jgi:hypothetical protein